MKRALVVLAVLAATLITSGYAEAEDGEEEGLLVSERPHICDESRRNYWETFIYRGT